VPFKTRPSSNLKLRYRNEIESWSTPCNRPPHDTRMKGTPFARPRPLPVAQKLSRYTNTVCSRHEPVSILEHYTATKSFRAARAVFPLCSLKIGLWYVVSQGKFYWNNTRNCEELEHSPEQTGANADIEIIYRVARNTLNCGRLSLSGRWTFLVSAVKLFCRVFLTSKTKSFFFVLFN
jgi:hypothetical protein